MASTLSTRTAYRFADAYVGQTDPKEMIRLLCDMLDRQERERVRLATVALANPIADGIYANADAKIFGFGVQQSLGPGLSIGSLVYVQRARNVAAADASLGFPAAGVVVAQLSGGSVLWAPLALLEIFVQGDPNDVQPTATNVLWLGDAGFGAFKPPTTDGSVAQQVGYRYYANAATHRSYCLIFPGAVRVGL